VERLSEGRDHPIVPPCRVLKIQKSVRLPLPTQAIDESSIDGNMEYLDAINHDVLNLPQEFFNNRYMMYFGNLATIRNLRGIKAMRERDGSPYERYDFMIPIPQLFHTRMTHLRQVYTVHWGAEGKDVLGIIHETKYELRRKSIDEKNKGYI